jgi:hypothetical protein
LQAMGLSGISKSQVSKLYNEIAERVHAFLDRPLTGGGAAFFVVYLLQSGVPTPVVFASHGGVAEGRKRKAVKD